MLRSRKSRREESLGAHVPEPMVSREDGIDPEHEALLAESVGLALLVVLETLAPAERVAFVLHDTFDLPFDEIAPIVGRQTFARASSSAGTARETCAVASRGHTRAETSALPVNPQMPMTAGRGCPATRQSSR
jgi:RNA polymerase sigma-70 factor, ECF subfamily